MLLLPLDHCLVSVPSLEDNINVIVSINIHKILTVLESFKRSILKHLLMFEPILIWKFPQLYPVDPKTTAQKIYSHKVNWDDQMLTLVLALLTIIFLPNLMIHHMFCDLSFLYGYIMHCILRSIKVYAFLIWSESH